MVLSKGTLCTLCLLCAPVLGLFTVPPVQAQEPLPKPKQSDKAWVALSVASYIPATLDIERTLHTKGELGSQFVEYNPLARPLVGLPKPAYIAVGMGMVTLNNYLALRMKHSHTWLHRIWWMPQLFQIGGNLAGFTTTPVH